MKLEKGGLLARIATDEADIDRAQELRHLSFLAARGMCRPGGRDVDRFDSLCDHILIEDTDNQRLLGCFRLMVLPFAALMTSYSAQFYDLAPLSHRTGQAMELGRFCLHPSVEDPHVLRLAWAAVTQMVDAHGVGLIFGCTSFAGADPDLHAEALALLGQTHLAPEDMRPGRKAARIVGLPNTPVDARRAMAALPPLLRSYLGMGGWVSDHAVLDAELDTLHVFTGLEVERIPAARVKALRSLAG